MISGKTGLKIAQVILKIAQACPVKQGVMHLAYWLVHYTFIIILRIDCFSGFKFFNFFPIRLRI